MDPNAIVLGQPQRMGQIQEQPIPVQPSLPGPSPTIAAEPLQPPQKLPELTPKQAQIVQAKVYAELHDISQAVVAQGVYPNASPEAAAVMVSRELRKDNVKSALQIALAKHGLTTDSVVKVVGEAMVATKPNPKDPPAPNKDGSPPAKAYQEDVPDHSIRLKAAGMAARYLGLDKPDEGGTTNYNFVNISQEQRQKYGL